MAVTMKQIAPGISVPADYDPLANYKPKPVTAYQQPSSYGGINPDAFGNALAQIGQTIKPFSEPQSAIKNQINNTSQPAQPLSFAPAAPAPAPDTFMQDMIKSINDLYDKRMSAGKTALTNTRDTELQGLTGQETTAHQGAYGARNNADAGTLQAMQRLREENARNGLLASGDNVTATTGLNVARENSLNTINQQENNIVQDISGKRSLINNQAASKDMALLNEIEAQRIASQQDAMKYGDTREFRNREADRQQQLRELELAMQGKQANLNAALQVGDRTQRLVAPTEDWGLLFQQPNAPLTPQGQSTQLQQAQVMATLTGRMPDGTATTSEQQRQLENLWTAATQTGTIPDQLAEMYGIPKGTPTRAASEFAKQLAISQQNANTSQSNANASGANSKNTVAVREIESEVYNHAQDFQSAQDVTDYFNVNSAYLAKNLGAKGVDDLKKSFMSSFSADNKEGNSTYKEAVALAQKDTRWALPSADKKALIKEYQVLLSPN